MTNENINTPPHTAQSAGWFFKKRYESGLWGMETVTLIYMVFTSALMAIYWDNLNDPMSMVSTRVLMLLGMGFTYCLYRACPCPALRILRVIIPGLGLIAWYPETYDFCSQFPYLDHIFAEADQTFFGCQPALLFSTLLPSTFWCEAINLGYYSYYYMMMATIMFYMLFRYPQADRAGFVFLASFFLFYIIYEFVPVAGPQFYFKAVGTEAADTGCFPAVGYHFNTHTEMIPLDVRGVFSRLVLSAQEIGERPTAAFPSSHVGMGTVTMILAWKAKNRWLFWLMAPFYLLLCCGTIYIKAHYLVDSIAGFFVAILFYWITNTIYNKIIRELRIKN